MAYSLHETKRDLRILQKGLKSLIETGFVPDEVIQSQRPFCPYKAAEEVRCDNNCPAFKETLALHMALEAMLYQSRVESKYDSETLRLATKDVIDRTSILPDTHKCRHLREVS